MSNRYLSKIHHFCSSSPQLPLKILVQQQQPPAATNLVEVHPHHSQSGGFRWAQRCVVQHGGGGLDLTWLVAAHGRVVANHVNPETQHIKTGHLGILDEEQCPSLMQNRNEMSEKLQLLLLVK